MEEETSNNNTINVTNEPPLKKQKLIDIKLDYDNKYLEEYKNSSSTSPDLCQNSMRKGQDRIQYLGIPLKSQDDSKEYRTIRLENGLTVLLISDSEQHSYEEAMNCCLNDLANKLEDAESEEKTNHEYMALGSLCINVGSFSDPSHIPGLAHLLEHTISMGSKKYPKENDYHAFVEQRWGCCNAFTEYENTWYSFQVPEKYLLGTLDRFANFFIDPLLTKNVISCECHSIDNEFKLTQQSDDVKKFQLLLSLKRKDHPASIFSCGNNITLQQDIDIDSLHSELHEFRKQHYSAHRMTLVIQASLSLDTLEDFTKQCFSDIPVNYLPPDDFSQYLGMDCFDSSKFKRMYYMQTMKDILEIELNWVMPPMCHLYKSKPWFYISELLFRTDEGSLFNYLGKKMWGSRKDCEDALFFTSTYSIFSLRLNLTGDGYNHLNEVLKIIFSYINFIQQECTDQLIFDKFLEYTKECSSFSTHNEFPIDNDVENIALNMQYYPPTYYLNGYELVFEYDPKAVQKFINILRPDNVNIIISTKRLDKVNCDKVKCEREVVYQTEYFSKEIPEEWIESWRKAEPLPDFHLELKKSEIQVNSCSVNLPENHFVNLLKIDNDKNIDLWYKQDLTSDSSKFSMCLHLNHPSLYESSSNFAVINVVIFIFNILIKKPSCGISSLTFSCKGFLIDIPETMKTRSLGQLALLLFDFIFCEKFMTEELFKSAKSEILRRYYNIFISPAKLMREAWLSLTVSKYWMSHERYNALIDMPYSQFIEIVRKGPKKFHAACLVEGNMKEEEIIKCVCQIVEPFLLKTESSGNHTSKILKFMNGEKCCQIKNINLSDAVTIVNNFYQTDVVSAKLLVICKLLAVIINEPLFHCLRTQEQLGYHVEFGHSYLHGIIFLEVTVFTQADKFTGEYVNGKIQNFINDYAFVLKNMTSKEFDLVKENYIKSSSNTEAVSNEEMLLGTDVLGEPLANICEKEMETLESITLDELYSSFANYCVAGGAGYKKISLQVVGTSNPSVISENGNTCKDGKYILRYSTEVQEHEKLNSDYYIDDINTYKRNLSTY